MMNHHLLIIVFAIYLVQRLSELWISSINFKKLKVDYHAKLASKWDSVRMKLLHLSWFICWPIEALMTNRKVNFGLIVSLFTILFICQLVRLHSMKMLGKFWTINVYQMVAHPIVTSGLYRYIRHPNYLIVYFELLFIPIIFGSYCTAIVFFIFNSYVIRQRINLEEKLLSQESDYLVHFKNINRFIPI